jgi:hypothetical protein
MVRYGLSIGKVKKLKKAGANEGQDLVTTPAQPQLNDTNGTSPSTRSYFGLGESTGEQAAGSKPTPRDRHYNDHSQAVVARQSPAARASAHRCETLLQFVQFAAWAGTHPNPRSVSPHVQ